MNTMLHKGPARPPRYSNDKRRNATNLASQILNHPRLKGKLYGKFYNRYTFEIDVLPTEEELQPKEVIKLKPAKKRLTPEEKLALSNNLAGSAKMFSYQGVEDAIKIANRDYDQEEED